MIDEVVALREARVFVDVWSVCPCRCCTQLLLTRANLHQDAVNGDGASMSAVYETMFRHQRQGLLGLSKAKA